QQTLRHSRSGKHPRTCRTIQKCSRESANSWFYGQKCALVLPSGSSIADCSQDKEDCRKCRSRRLPHRNLSLVDPTACQILHRIETSPPFLCGGRCSTSPAVARCRT